MSWFVFSVISLLVAYLGDSDNLIVKNEVLQKFFRVILIFVLSYVIGFSGEAFTDHVGYRDFFSQIEDVDLPKFNIFVNVFEERGTGMEIGYIMLNKIFYALGLDYVGFFFMIALITNSLLVSVIYRFKYATFNILVFITSGIYWQECNLVRQCLAIAIVLYSIKYLENKNVYMYVFFVLCASLIHTSAIFMLVFFVYAIVDIRKIVFKINNVLFLLWILSIAISIKLIPFDFYDLLPIDFFYGNYIESGTTAGVEDLGVYALFYNLSLIVFFICHDRFLDSNKFIYSILFVLGGILTNLAVVVPSIYRLSLYFSVTLFTMSSFFIRQNIKKKYKEIINIPFVLLVILFVYRVVYNMFTAELPITYELHQFLR